MQLLKDRFPPGLVVGIILALFFGIALYLRICLPYDQVFSGDGIKFTGIDAYYHMRLVDNLVVNFPYRIGFDPYTSYPYGAAVGWFPLFYGLLGGIIWLIGLGSPTQHTVDVVGVYFPAVLGALTVIPVYFIGKAVFNRWAGVIAAGLIAMMPGEFMGRSILGFTDHDIAGSLFSTAAILFLILAIKVARQRQLSFHHLKQRDWSTCARPTIYSLLAGIFLGIYLLTWTGGLLFVFIIFVYFIIQFIIDHLRHRATDYLCLAGAVPFFIALIMLLPTSQENLYLASLVIALLTPLVLGGISYLLTSREIKPVYYPLTLTGLGLAGLALFWLINPSFLKSISVLLRMFVPDRVTTIREAQSILFPSGEFSLLPIWYNFTTGFYLSLIALAILVYIITKQGSPEKSLLVVWSLAILAATLGQRRFAIYFAVNVALLTGYLSWLILEFAGFKKLIAKPVEVPGRVERKKAKLKKRQETGFHLTTSHINMGLGAIAIFFLVFFPNIRPAIATASQARFAPSDGWVSSLSWLKENTPDPFGDPNFYYQVYQPPPPGEDYHHPSSAYGVMAWWDYGHWITRISRRLPNATPAAWGSCAPFFGAQDEASANEIMDELGIRYVIVDHEIATTKFHAVVALTGKSEEEFYDNYYLAQRGELVTVFFPEYYRSLATRLYNFDGKAVEPQETVVISYQEKAGQNGVPYKQLTGSKSFPSYEAATSYISSQKSDKYRIVGTSPFTSPVPLEELAHYRLVHSSDSMILKPGGGMSSEIKIFEYTK